MRALALEGPYTLKEKTDLLDYCQSDVLATEAILKRWQRLIDIDRALIRRVHQGSFSNRGGGFR